jgi:hypothetical protein
VVYTNGNRTYAEPINERNLPCDIDSRDTYLDDLISELNSNENYVLKMHAKPMDDLEDYYISHDRETTFFQQFITIPDYAIAVIRRNLFDVAISLAYSIHTKAWIHPYPTDTITVDPVAFKQQCHVAYISQYLTLQNNYYIPFNELVVYEDLFSLDTDEDRFASLSLCKDFDIELVNFEPRHDMMINRMTKAPSKQNIIKNYAELENIAVGVFNQIPPNCFITLNGYNIETYNDRNLFND